MLGAFDLIDAPLMPSAFEGRLKEGAEDLFGEPFAHDARTKAKHICVVVLACGFRHVGIGAERGADPLEAIRLGRYNP